MDRFFCWRPDSRLGGRGWHLSKGFGVTMLLLGGDASGERDRDISKSSCQLITPVFTYFTLRYPSHLGHVGPCGPQVTVHAAAADPQGQSCAAKRTGCGGRIGRVARCLGRHGCAVKLPLAALPARLYCC